METIQNIICECRKLWNVKTASRYENLTSEVEYLFKKPWLFKKHWLCDTIIISKVYEHVRYFCRAFFVSLYFFHSFFVWYIWFIVIFVHSVIFLVLLDLANGLWVPLLRVNAKYFRSPPARFSVAEKRILEESPHSPRTHCQLQIRKYVIVI